MSMKAVIAERGQVTIPKALRQKLGLHPGVILEFAVEDGKLIATKVAPTSPVDRLYGTLANGSNTDAFIAELRDRP
jgi:antitoxin PrlF